MNIPLSVAGSAVVPVEVVSSLFVLFLGLLLIVFGILHKHLSPLHLHHKIYLFLGTTLALKIAFIGGGLLVSAYWLVPVPRVVATTPENGYSNSATREKIEITFSRPIARQPIQKSITPEAPGVWIFEEPVYGAHLYYKLVFYPSYSLEPDTTYSISIENIRNLAQFSEPIDYEFSFTTQKAPKVARIIPGNDSLEVPISQAIQVELDGPNDHMVDLSFEIQPKVAFDIVPDATRKNYLLIPMQPLAQGTAYSLKVLETPLQTDLNSGEISSRGQTRLSQQISFITKPAPGISMISPSGNLVTVDSSIDLEFSRAVERQSVEQNFAIKPPTNLSFQWLSDTKVRIVPNQLNYDTHYDLAIESGVHTLDGGYLEEAINHSFKTIGPVEIMSIYPENNWQGLSLSAPITVEFNQVVDHSSAETAFSIQPEIQGTFSWQENTLTYTPTQSYAYGQTYQVSIDAGIKSIKGQDSQQTWTSSFTTQHQTIKLAITPHLQEHSLSCEVATLKMALAYRGINVSEMQLMQDVGVVQPFNKQGTIWGDPHQGFVGDVDGRQMVTGYGVYWGPIARASRNYRDAREFSGWSTSQLTNEIVQNNPVIIWAYSKGGKPTTWYTPEGKEIYAISGEHTFIVKGFVGPAENPSQIILNDPLIGEIYWSRSHFEAMWASLGNSGVVVY